eukprot:CAMPEP_0183353718 /NCGR_PEP_ID=MMETSP0164_2-20130417/34656_1 /TAXON_ID=221442 /ORGANISM="Coccolithus pelagicus ssp braarudi, Strain PLY182g" /LENGTH=124 /DNA_ID=CAMNT_0025526447 /DNA_START=378 /DNA_END=748 /DNA_ORIENTATION=+
MTMHALQTPLQTVDEAKSLSYSLHATSRQLPRHEMQRARCSRSGRSRCPPTGVAAQVPLAAQARGVQCHDAVQTSLRRKASPAQSICHAASPRQGQARARNVRGTAGWEAAALESGKSEPSFQT